MDDTTKPRRRLTLTLNFLREEGGRPPAKDLYVFIVARLECRLEDIEGIDQEFGSDRVHVKVKSYEMKTDAWWDARLSKPKMEMECSDGTVRTVYVTINGGKLWKVKIRNLPFEVSNEMIVDALRNSILVCDIFEERYGEEHVFRSIKTGVRILIGILKVHIPNYYEIEGFTAYVEYAGQPRSCAICSSYKHLRAKCPKRQRLWKPEERERQPVTEDEGADDDSDAAPESRRAESEPPPSLPPLLAATPPAASASQADDAPPHQNPPPADVTLPADKPPGESEQPASDVDRPAADAPPGNNTKPQQQPVSGKAKHVEKLDRIKESARKRSTSRKRGASKSPEREKEVKTRGRDKKDKQK